MRLVDVPRPRFGDPGAAPLRPDMAMVVGLAAAAAAVALSLLPSSDHDLVAIGAALFVAELMTFRLADGSAMSGWTAPLLPLIATSEVGVVAVVVVATQALAFPVQWRDLGRSAPLRVVHRLVGAVLAWLAYRMTVHVLGPGGVVGVTLPALAAGAVAAVLTEVVGRRLRRLPSFWAAGGGGAALAQGASGILMALALVPEAGDGRMGVWGLVLFAVPLLGARYAYGRLQAIRLAYDQTIEVLSTLPEHGGYVRPGHSSRVAGLCGEIGRRLGVTGSHLHDLERAALLHAVGSVTLDDPDADAGEVARATAAMLAGTEGLSRTAEIVAAVPLPYRAPEVATSPEQRMAAQILKVANAFYEATGGDEKRSADALEELYSAPGYLYDPRVLGTLERILDRRGVPVGA